MYYRQIEPTFTCQYLPNWKDLSNLLGYSWQSDERINNQRMLAAVPFVKTYLDFINHELDKLYQDPTYKVSMNNLKVMDVHYVLGLVTKNKYMG